MVKDHAANSCKNFQHTMDTDTDRSKILADFQACANIDDIEHALTVLEVTNWDLTEAINMAMSSENTPGLVNDTGPTMSVNGRGIDVTGSHRHSDIFTGRGSTLASSNPFDQLSQRERSSLPRRTIFNTNIDPARERPDTFGVNRRLINFHIQYNEDLMEIQLMDTDIVEELMDRISARIGKDKTEFTIAWQDQRVHAENNHTLRELNLPRENTIRVIPMTEPTACTASTEPVASTSTHINRSISENLASMFKLQIDVASGPGNSERDELVESGTKTVREIKEYIESRHGIEISAQIWIGWSIHVTDDMTLAACQLSFPTHKLTVSRRGSSRSRFDDMAEESYPAVATDSESDNDFDMMSDDQDMDISMETGQSAAQREPLIPAHIDDPVEAAANFNTQFIRRYGGVNQPLFFAGSFKDAVDHALQCPASERRLLAVYLHHDASIAANVFCTQVLCSETVANYLTSNFVTWGWDLTLAINKTRFVGMFELVIGKSASDVVRQLSADELPVLVILAKLRGSLEILAMSRSSVSADEMMTTLLQAEDVFLQGRGQDVREEEERKSREEMKMLQDAAYEESLAVDRVKREKQQQEEEEQTRLIREEQAAQQLEQETIEALKQSVAETIPEEPPADCQDAMARLRFRCSSGEMINRRFLGSTTLRTLFNYLVTKSYRTEEYKVLTTFPRRDLTQEDESKTLEELKLCPQETLILESK